MMSTPRRQQSARQRLRHQLKVAALVGGLGAVGFGAGRVLRTRAALERIRYRSLPRQFVPWVIRTLKNRPWVPPVIEMQEVRQPRKWVRTRNNALIARVMGRLATVWGAGLGAGALLGEGVARLRKRQGSRELSAPKAGALAGGILIATMPAHRAVALLARPRPFVLPRSVSRGVSKVYRAGRRAVSQWIVRRGPRALMRVR
jgi:hypothetical protein